MVKYGSLAGCLKKEKVYHDCYFNDSTTTIGTLHVFKISTHALG